MMHHNTNQPVAWLQFYHRSFEGGDNVRHIFANDQFDIGRKDVENIWVTKEMTISTHHMRFRCVMFEDDGQEIIAPLIYVHALSSNPVIITRRDSTNLRGEFRLTKHSGDVLLNHGDALRLTSSISVTIYENPKLSPPLAFLSEVQRAETQLFASQYLVIDRILGTGGHGGVFVAVKQSTQSQVACKILSLPKKVSTPTWSAEEAAEREQRQLKKREDLAREYDVLKNINNHPNIISLEKVFCTSHHIYIFQELITGGDLLSYLDHMGALREPEAAVIVRQIVKAVEYLHSNGIVHRDIKPENVLLTSWKEGARIVLTDFGQARMIGQATAVFRMQSIVGTHGYTAPEVYQQLGQGSRRAPGYSKAIDIWSIGCLSATLLTNELILADDVNKNAIAQVIGDSSHSDRCWDIHIMNVRPEWQRIGRKAKSFIKACLSVDESQRMTAEQALQHEWFTNRHYAAELEAAYERAIADWKPRKRNPDIIEFLDTASISEEGWQQGKVDSLSEQTKSKHITDTRMQTDIPGSILNSALPCLPSPKSHTPLGSISESFV